MAIAIQQDTIKANIVMRDTLKSGRAIVSSKDSLKNVPVVIKRPVNPNEKYIRELYRRTFELVTPVMDVEADSLTVSFYDNGEIDNDTISVFYNRKPVLLSQMLSGKPITLKLRLDTAVNEISMFAENLGRIPPNTAVAIIYAGGQRYELNLSSSLMTNATVRFRKKSNSDSGNERRVADKMGQRCARSYLESCCCRGLAGTSIQTRNK